MSSNPLSKCLVGFEKIHRYWDPARQTAIAKIQPGEFYVTTQDEGIYTVLGSCIAACIRDTQLGIGGMNHFMLPHKGSVFEKSHIIDEAARYGNWAMEYLINQILKAGGRRRCLEVKIFGGANVVNSMSSDVGAQNINFTKDYIFNENLNLIAQDVGGTAARNVVYFPKTGKVQLKYVVDLKGENLAEQERQYYSSINKGSASSGDVELF